MRRAMWKNINPPYAGPYINKARAKYGYSNIIPAGQKESIKTIMGIGWNPEICRGIINAPKGVFQYGY